MATDTADGWTEMKCIELIREFRKRSVLWDQKNPLFYKKGTKPCAWKDISRVLRMSPDRCKHKMVVLMSSFRREKSKMLNSLKEVEDRSYAYQSSWFGFKEMSFLLDKESERKRKMEMITIENDDASVEINIYEDTKPLLNKPHENWKCPRRSLENNEQDVRNRKTPKITIEDYQATIISQLGQRSAVSGHDDGEIKHFSNFIAAKMRKYNEATKNAVQQAICEVIFKADQNYLDPKASEINCMRSRDPLEEPLPGGSNSYMSLKVSYSDESE